MTKKDIFLNLLTTLLVVCAILITAIIIRREFFLSQSQTNSTEAETFIENWKELEFAGPEGNFPDARVQIIKFFDYQCPWCERAQAPVNAIHEKYKAEVNFRYEHFPLTTHDHANEAAIAAECARNQDAFNPYHSFLFERQNQLGSFSYIDLAKEAGVGDIPLFSSCIENRETASIVEAGSRLAQELNVSTIPTFLINGRLVPGFLTEEELSVYIEEELAE